MHHFVAFEIKRPIARAIEERDGFLLAVNESLHFQIITNALIPLRMDDADFWIVDGLNFRLRSIVTRSQSDDKFIHNRQNGLNGFLERIAKLLRVPQKGEAADFHLCKIKD